MYIDFVEGDLAVLEDDEVEAAHAAAFAIGADLRVPAAAITVVGRPDFLGRVGRGRHRGEEAGEIGAERGVAGDAGSGLRVLVERVLRIEREKARNVLV